MKLLRALTMLLWVCGVLAAAQTAVVKRNVYLRPQPSTNNHAIEKLTPGMQIEVLDPSPTNGFFHARVNNQVGWVWSANLQIQPAPSSAPVSGGTLTENPAIAISSAWDKPAPQDSVFHSDEGDCGETGDDEDTDTNRRKNRIDVPPVYRAVTWNAINTLAYPHGAHRSRMNWTQSQLGQILPFEGVAITVEGFLYKVKVESTSRSAKKGGESTNCHARLANDVDWHMPLTAHVGDGEDLAIIVETTPRVRQGHSNWTTARLKPWTGHLGGQPNPSYNQQKVRISGWLMLDPEHQDMIDGGLRSTLWEIHPITRIEVWDNGTWSDLDSQP